MTQNKKQKPKENIVVDIRDKILSSNDIKEEKLYIKEWDVEVLVRGLSGEARASVISENYKDGKLDIKKAYPELIIESVYNTETKKKIFKPTDRDALAKKSGAALEKIAQVTMRLSGIGEDRLEEIEKN